MTTPTYEVHPRREPRAGSAETTRSTSGAWAGSPSQSVMLGLAGTWNVIDGILALANSKVYGVNRTYVFSDLRTWGWIVLLLGCLQLLAAFLIFAGSEFARWFGIGAAG